MNAEGAHLRDGDKLGISGDGYLWAFLGNLTPNSVAPPWLRYFPTPRGECAPLCSDQAEVDNRTVASDRKSEARSLMTEVLQCSPYRQIHCQRKILHIFIFCRFYLLSVRIWARRALCLKSASYDRAGSPFVTAVEMLALSAPGVR